MSAQQLEMSSRSDQHKKRLHVGGAGFPEPLLFPHIWDSGPNCTRVLWQGMLYSKNATTKQHVLKSLRHLNDSICKYSQLFMSAEQHKCLYGGRPWVARHKLHATTTRRLTTTRQRQVKTNVLSGNKCRPTLVNLHGSGVGSRNRRFTESRTSRNGDVPDHQEDRTEKQNQSPRR